MRGPRQAAGELFDNPILVGTVTILVVLVAVYLSYIAENGLPFVPTYNVYVEVQNASELVKNADVRIGGARVGQVLTITPEPASRRYPYPYAKLGLALQQSLEPLPADTRYQVRLASVLGGKYVELFPGHARGGVADGGTLTIATTARTHNIPFVDLDTAFATFGPKTQAGLRSALAEFADAVAGRGIQFNETIAATDRLIGPAESLLRLLADPRTRLAQFVDGLAATTEALAPVASTITAALNDGATTFAALNRSALGTAIDQTPPTESLATTVLTNAQPVLNDAGAIVGELRPGAALLPVAGPRLDEIIRDATPVFRRVPALSNQLQQALAAVGALARDPNSVETFKILGSSDLATFGTSAFLGLGALLRTVAAEQFDCNITSLWLHNFAGGLSEGDANGAWLRFSPILDSGETFQVSQPSADLHINPYPVESGGQCQAGNEVYRGAQQIGAYPGRTSGATLHTTPPPGVLARGKQAGLVP